jgi:hypothetical protein
MTGLVNLAVPRLPVGVKTLKETSMRRMAWAVLLFAFASSTSAQMGMNLFKKPDFTKAFHPVVGQGAEYQSTSKRGSADKTSTMDMGIVGKESVGGQDAYWMQMIMNSESGQSVVAKMLLNPADFQSARLIVQMPGRPAMEMPVNMAGANRDKATASAQDWHSVGTETITVPAGTFSCEHWKNDTNGSEVWTSDKVTPFGLVRETSSDHSRVLTKILSDYPDRITGPVQKFDPAMMMQQMQRGQQQP